VPGHGGRVGESWGELLRSFDRFLGLEQGRSPHTRRAYLGDVRGLIAFADPPPPAAPPPAPPSAWPQAPGAVDERAAHPELVDLALLREWLARMSDEGLGRSTLARRAASARAFTRWLVRTGRTTQDAGIRLRSPKARRALPSVLRLDQAAALMNVGQADVEQAVEAAADRAVRVRDRAILELLYATGIRVSELTCRTWTRLAVPSGSSARVTSSGWCRSASRQQTPSATGSRRHESCWRRPAGPVTPCLSAVADAGSTRARSASWCTPPCPRWRGRRRWGRTGYATRLQLIFWTAARTSVAFRSCSVTLRCQPHRSTRTSPWRGSVPDIGRPTLARDVDVRPKGVRQRGRRRGAGR